MLGWLILIAIVGLIFGAGWASDFFSGLSGIFGVITIVCLGFAGLLLVAWGIGWLIQHWNDD